MPSDLWWGFWSDYPKVSRNGRLYAKIGDRLYTEHAVERFLPSGRRTIGDRPRAYAEGGGYTYNRYARSVSPFYAEEAILHGTKKWAVEGDELRTVHCHGDLEVVTTRDDQIVITVGYRHVG